MPRTLLPPAIAALLCLAAALQLKIALVDHRLPGDPMGRAATTLGL